jgi:hypothetical protein
MERAFTETTSNLRSYEGTRRGGYLHLLVYSKQIRIASVKKAFSKYELITGVKINLAKFDKDGNQSDTGYDVFTTTTTDLSTFSLHGLITDDKKAQSANYFSWPPTAAAKEAAELAQVRNDWGDGGFPAPDATPGPVGICKASTPEPVSKSAPAPRIVKARGSSIPPLEFDVLKSTVNKIDEDQQIVLSDVEDIQEGVKEVKTEQKKHTEALDALKKGQAAIYTVVDGQVEPLIEHLTTLQTEKKHAEHISHKVRGKLGSEVRVVNKRYREEIQDLRSANARLKRQLVDKDELLTRMDARMGGIEMQLEAVHEQNDKIYELLGRFL